jgi:S-methylmethionine-dependent homocysteine/selenocysteine methylase
VKVAGSLPPALGSYRPDLFEEQAASAILTVLIEALSPHVDIWLAETLSALAEARLVADLLQEDTRPLWLSFTVRDEGETALRSGESVSDAAALALKVGAAAILFNCSRPEAMNAAVCEAKLAIGPDDLAIGVYANGFAAAADEKDANVDLQQIRSDLGPDAYVRWTRQWVVSGATLIGGCCGVGAAHIAALAQAGLQRVERGDRVPE